MLKEKIQSIIKNRDATQQKRLDRKLIARTTRLQNLEQFIYSKLANINERMLKEAKYFNKYDDEVMICAIPSWSWPRGWTSKEVRGIDKIMDKIKKDTTFDEFKIRVVEEMRMTHWDGSYDHLYYLVARVK